MLCFLLYHCIIISNVENEEADSQSHSIKHYTSHDILTLTVDSLHFFFFVGQCGQTYSFSNSYPYRTDLKMYQSFKNITHTPLTNIPCIFICIHVGGTFIQKKTYIWRIKFKFRLNC